MNTDLTDWSNFFFPLIALLLPLLPPRLVLPPQLGGKGVGVNTDLTDWSNFFFPLIALLLPLLPPRLVLPPLLGGDGGGGGKY